MQVVEDEDGGKNWSSKKGLKRQGAAGYVPETASLWRQRSTFSNFEMRGFGCRTYLRGVSYPLLEPHLHLLVVDLSDMASEQCKGVSPSCGVLLLLAGGISHPSLWLAAGDFYTTQ